MILGVKCLLWRWTWVLSSNAHTCFFIFLFVCPFVCFIAFADRSTLYRPSCLPGHSVCRLNWKGNILKVKINFKTSKSRLDFFTHFPFWIYSRGLHFIMCLHFIMLQRLNIKVSGSYQTFCVCLYLWMWMFIGWNCNSALLLYLRFYLPLLSGFCLVRQFLLKHMYTKDIVQKYYSRCRIIKDPSSQHNNCLIVVLQL